MKWKKKKKKRTRNRKNFEWIRPLIPPSSIPQKKEKERIRQRGNSSKIVKKTSKR
jgi:hypothetical protein